MSKLSAKETVIGDGVALLYRRFRQCYGSEESALAARWNQKAPRSIKRLVLFEDGSGMVESNSTVLGVSEEAEHVSWNTLAEGCQKLLGVFNKRSGACDNGEKVAARADRD